MAACNEYMPRICECDFYSQSEFISGPAFLFRQAPLEGFRRQFQAFLSIEHLYTALLHWATLLDHVFFVGMGRGSS